MERCDNYDGKVQAIYDRALWLRQAQLGAAYIIFYMVDDFCERLYKICLGDISDIVLVSLFIERRLPPQYGKPQIH